MLKFDFIEKIFSIKNDLIYKNITIFGINFKINMQKIRQKELDKIQVDNNVIAFYTHTGGTYGCNPKYIVEEILKRKLPYKILWMCHDKKIYLENDIPKDISVLYYKNFNDLKKFSSAKVYISNERLDNLIVKGWQKKKLQKYIQTWHGSLGIKKFGKSVETCTYFENNKNKFEYFDKDGEFIDYLLVNSDYYEPIFKNEWGENKVILKIGTPRNDLFFYSDEKKYEIRKKVCKEFNISLDSNLVLYAPTFRPDNRLDCYKLDTENLLSELNKKYSKDWIFLTRLHPKMRELSKELFDYSSNIVDVSNYSDIQELLVASDMMITDYSSCVFDFMLSRKPAFIFATDIQKYNTERGFYYPLETTPFPIAVNNKELLKNVENFNLNEYKLKIENFIKEKGCVENGTACKKVVDLIEEIMNEDIDE